uniref:Uncharacterized protein n=1 Tax=Arundo donax TaxID=35708 RepID=A0A0A9E4A3_ARUDO
MRWIQSSVSCCSESLVPFSISIISEFRKMVEKLYKPA